MNRQLSLRNFSVHQADQESLGFLLGGENRFEVGLRRFELGLFYFLRSLVSGEQILDLGGGGVVINRLLQGVLFQAGLAEDAGAGAICRLIGVIAATSATAEHPAHAASADREAGVHDFLDERFYGVPLRVVGEAKLFLSPVQHALLYLGGVKIAAAGAATLAALAGIVGVAGGIVILRKQTGGADGERGRHGAQGDDAIEFH